VFDKSTTSFSRIRNSLIILRSRLAQAVTRQASARTESLFLLGVLWSSSVTPDECLDRTLKYATTASFHTLSSHHDGETKRRKEKQQKEIITERNKKKQNGFISLRPP
jgi:hypothetical protein